MTTAAVTRSPADAASEPAPKERLPRHVAIIMDGNRRWARAHGVPEAQGHAAGVEAVRPIVEHAAKLGIEVLTIYAFSRENWQRSSQEVEGLMALLEAAIRDETPRLIEQGVRVRLAGRLQELPSATRASIEEAVRLTGAGQRMILNVAFNYSSRAEIVDALRAYVAAGNDLADLDEDSLGCHLYSAELPELDLLIRTGGDQRVSNFMLWQAAYSELYFCECFWPDFGPADLDAAFSEFASRARRFGR